MEKFDQSSKGMGYWHATLINNISPRSLEAMKRQGIKFKDIIRLSKEQVMEMYKDKKFASQEVFDMFYDHLEERRMNKINAAIKVNSKTNLIAGD